MWRVLISLFTAIGALFVARTYTEEPRRTAVTTTPRPTGVGAAAAGETAPESEHHKPETALRPGWSRPKPEVIPRATYWPILFAGGTSFIFWGVISDIWIFGAGLLLSVISMIGWTNDLLNE